MKKRLAVNRLCGIAALFLVFVCGHLFLSGDNGDGLHSTAKHVEPKVSAAGEILAEGYHKGFLLEAKTFVLHASSNQTEASQNAASTKTKKKLILLWTTKFGEKDWLTDSDVKSCSVRCEVTSDKHRLSQSDAIIFHGGDFTNVTNFPRERHPGQRWVYFGMESPPHTHAPMSTSQFNSVFNWTASYRRDADIVVGYGSTFKLKTPLTKKEHWRFKKTYIRRKSRLVLARISHCQQISNHRMDYIREMKKYIDVDVYGDCGENICPKYSSYCDYELPKLYKFFLAFENSCCRDYVTEKFWMPLGVFNSIPVVMGGARGHGEEYESMAPTNSFINAAHFWSAKQLSLYLKQLDKNQEKYEAYFEWKKTQYVKYHNDWCLLCEALHDKKRPVQTYTEFKTWYEDDDCLRKAPRGKRDQCDAVHIN